MTLIDSFDWASLLSNDINESWTNWCEQFLTIMRECIPTKTLPKRKNLPWLSKGLEEISYISEENTLETYQGTSW